MPSNYERKPLAVGTYQSNSRRLVFLESPCIGVVSQIKDLDSAALTYKRTLRNNPHSYAVRRFSPVLHYFFASPVEIIDFLSSPFFYLIRKHSLFDFEIYISPVTDRIIKRPATNWEIPNTLGIKYRIYRVLRIPSSASLPTEYHSI